MAGAEVLRVISLVAVVLLLASGGLTLPLLAVFGAGMVIGALFAARLMAVLDLGAVVATRSIAGPAAGLLMLLTI